MDITDRDDDRPTLKFPTDRPGALPEFTLMETLFGAFVLALIGLAYLASFLPQPEKDERRAA